MAFSLRYLINAGLLCVMLLATARAEPPAGRKAPPLKVRFFYIGYDFNEDAVLFPSLKALLGGGREAKELRLAPNALSPVYEYDGPRPPGLFREVRRADGLVVRESLAKLDYPAAWHGVLFLVTPKPDSPGFPFHFTPVEYSGDGMPEHSLRVMNLCPAPLAIKIADSSKVIPTLDQVDFTVSPKAEALPFVVARKQEDAWQVVISSARPRPESLRTLLLAFPDSPEFKTVRILQVENLPVSPPPGPH